MRSKKGLPDLYLPGMTGCSDGNCIFRKNSGMVTNGGCSCQRELQRTDVGLQAIRTILFLRKLTELVYDNGYYDGWDDAS